MGYVDESHRKLMGRVPAIISVYRFNVIQQASPTRLVPRSPK